MGSGEGGEGLAALRSTAWEEMFQIFMGPRVPSTTPTLQAQNYRGPHTPNPPPQLCFSDKFRLDRDWSSSLESPYQVVWPQFVSGFVPGVLRAVD